MRVYMYELLFTIRGKICVYENLCELLLYMYFHIVKIFNHETLKNENSYAMTQQISMDDEIYIHENLYLFSICIHVVYMSVNSCLLYICIVYSEI